MEVQRLVAASRAQPRSELDDSEGYLGHETWIVVHGDRTLPFRWEDQLPLVMGQVNGVDVECVPDTGSYGPALYLDWVAALRCGLYVPNLDRSGAQIGARRGNDWSVSAFADDASFGAVEISGGGRVEIIAPIPYGVLLPGEAVDTSDPLVGIGILTTHMIFAEPTEWDLPERTVRFLGDQVPQENGGQWATVPTRWEPGALRVWVSCQTPAGEFELLLDSGSQLTILPKAALAGAGALDSETAFLQASGEESVPTVMERASVGALGFGPSELLDLDVGLTTGEPGSPDPTLSLWDLRAHKIRIDAEARTIEVWVP